VQELQAALTLLTSQYGALSVSLARKIVPLDNLIPPEKTTITTNESQFPEGEESHEPENLDRVPIVESIIPSASDRESFAFPQLQLQPQDEFESSMESSSSEELLEPRVDVSIYTNEIAALSEQTQELLRKRAQNEMARRVEIESLSSKAVLLQTQLDAAQNSLQQFHSTNSQHQAACSRNEAEKQRLEDEIQSTINRMNEEIREVRDKFGRDSRKAEVEFQDLIGKLTEETQATTKVNAQKSLEIDALMKITKEKQEVVDDLRTKALEAELVRRRLCNDIQDLKGNIRILCAIRPPLDESAELAHLIYSEDSTEFTLSLSGNKHRFIFDAVIPPTGTTKHLFEEISPLIDSTLSGRNCTLLSYGFAGNLTNFVPHM
jgi:hypothetical protein